MLHLPDVGLLGNSHVLMQGQEQSAGRGPDLGMDLQARRTRRRIMKATSDLNVEALRSLRRPILLCWLAAVASTAVPAVAQEGSGHSEDGPVVNTTEGGVRGNTKKGADFFLDIPDNA